MRKVRLLKRMNLEIHGKFQRCGAGTIVEVGKQQGQAWVNTGAAQWVEKSTPVDYPPAMPLKKRGKEQAAHDPFPPSDLPMPVTGVDPQPMTIFALPRAFTDPHDVIQRNAIRSWLELRPTPQIILFGDDGGVAGICAELGLQHKPEIERSASGVPLIGGMWARAQEMAQHKLVAYVNADIILMQDFADAFAFVAERMPQFLMIGRRWNLPGFERVLDFRPSWQLHLRSVVAHDGIVYSTSGIDYFAFVNGLYREVPDFAIGRFSWDNWLASYAPGNGYPLVDASGAVLAVHQGGEGQTMPGLPEYEENRRLYDARPWGHKGHTTEADWRLLPHGLERAR